MSALDGAILYGAESTYGTAASLTRGYEGKADAFKRKQAYLESTGFRAGMHTLRSDRMVAINMGAEGFIEIDVLNKGMGLLLRDMFGVSTGPTQQGATTAYVQTHATNKDGPTTSSTIQLLRPNVGGTTQQFTYKGCVCTGWELSCDVERFFTIKVNYDAQDSDTSTAAGTPTYPATASPFSWGHPTVTIGGGAVDMRKLELKADYGMATNRHFLRTNVLKKKPQIAKRPEFTGSVEGEFESLTHYNRFVSGEIVAASFAWTFPANSIESGHTYEFTVTMPAIQYRGETPVMELEELTKQEIPFVVGHDGTNASITVTLKSTDTAF